MGSYVDKRDLALTTTVQLYQDQFDELKSICSDKKVSRSHILRAIVDRFLEDERNGSKNKKGKNSRGNN